MEEGVEGRSGADGDKAAFGGARRWDAGSGHRFGIFGKTATMKSAGRCPDRGHCCGLLVRKERGVVLIEGCCRRYFVGNQTTLYS